MENNEEVPTVDPYHAKVIERLEAQLEAEKQERTVEIRARKTLEVEVKELKAENERLVRQKWEALDRVEQAEERWKNAEDANIKLCEQLEEARAEIESRKKNAESRYHPMALLEEQNARLKKALECVYVWLANSQDNVKCKNNPFPDGIVKQTLQQLSNQGEAK